MSEERVVCRMPGCKTARMEGARYFCGLHAEAWNKSREFERACAGKNPPGKNEDRYRSMLHDFVIRVSSEEASKREVKQ